METFVFIDGAYLDKLLELNFNMAKINYAKFIQKLAADADNIKTIYYYHCPPHLPHSPTDFEKSRFSNKMKFFGALEQLEHFKTRLGRLVFRGTNKETNKPIFVQKKITTLFACDFLKEVYTYDSESCEAEKCFVLIAGDSEYTPLVELAQEEGHTVHLWHGISPDSKNNMVHKMLFDACDERLEITLDIIEKCLR